MMSQVHSQTISKEPRVKTIIGPKGDTLVQMNIKDAKILLSTVKQKEINDELLDQYMKRDTTQTNLIIVKDSTIKNLEGIVTNSVEMIKKIELINNNQKKEIVDLNTNIKQKDKEIKKQKILKKIGFIGCVVLPLITLFCVSSGVL